MTTKYSKLTSDRQFRTSHDSAQQPTTFSIKDKSHPTFIFPKLSIQLAAFNCFVAALPPKLNLHPLLGDSNAVPVQTMTAYRAAQVRKHSALTWHNMDVRGKLPAPATSCSGKQPQYPLNRRLHGLQSQSGHWWGVKNLLPLTGIKSQIIQSTSAIHIVTLRRHKKSDLLQHGNHKFHN